MKILIFRQKLTSNHSAIIYHSTTKYSTIIVHSNANKDMYMLIKANLQHNKFKANKM